MALYDFVNACNLLKGVNVLGVILQQFPFCL